MAEGHGGGGAFRAGSNHPALVSHHAKASQAFTPSFSKEGSFVSYSCRRVQLAFGCLSRYGIL